MGMKTRPDSQDPSLSLSYSFSRSLTWPGWSIQRKFEPIGTTASRSLSQRMCVCVCAAFDSICSLSLSSSTLYSLFSQFQLILPFFSSLSLYISRVFSFSPTRAEFLLSFLFFFFSGARAGVHITHPHRLFSIYV